MSAADIASRLREVLGGSIAAGDVDWGDLVAALGKTSIPVGATTVSGDAEPWIEWIQQQPGGGSGWKIRLSGRDVAGQAAPRYTLSLTDTGVESRLDALFPNLPPSLTTPDDPADRTGGLSVRPSVVGQLRVRGGTITVEPGPGGASAVPRFSGQLVTQGSRLEPYAAYLGSYPLILAGTVRLRGGTSPLLDLQAPGTGSMQLAATTLGPFGLSLRTDTIDRNVDNGDPSYASTVFLYADAKFGASQDRIRLTAQLLAGDFVWQFAADLGEDGLSVSRGLAMADALVHGENPTGLTLPDGLAPLDSFRLYHFGVDVRRPRPGKLPEIVRVEADLGSPRDGTSLWDPPIPFVTLKDVGVRVSYLPGTGFPSGVIWGTLQLGAKGGTQALAPASRPFDPVAVTASIAFPQMEMRAQLDAPLGVPLSNYLKLYFPEPVASIGKDLTIERFELGAGLRTRDFRGRIDIAGSWPIAIDEVTFALDGLNLLVNADQNGVTGELGAITSVSRKGVDKRVQLYTAATYPDDGNWEFEGRLLEPLELGDLVRIFTGWARPDWLPESQLIQFDARYSTAPGNPYSVTAKLGVYVRKEVLGVAVNIAFDAWVERRVTGPAPADKPKEPPTALSGGLQFDVKIEGFAIGGALSFSNAKPTYSFTIGWNGVRLLGAVKTITTDGVSHPVLAVRMGGVTLGAMVEYFVRLANPNANFHLDPPWDFLHAIDLEDFELLLDRRNSRIRLTYDVDVRLGFGTLSKVGLVCDRSSGRGVVRLIVEGAVLGQETGTLEWDAVRESPPAIPGQGQALFDLRYFGIGQHVAQIAPHAPVTGVADAVDGLRRAMTRPRLPTAPLGDSGGMRFDASRQWLFGLDCTIMDTVALKMILRDPDLYGVMVALSGARAGSLAGLMFELYYHKLNADVGVFRARLQIPDAFRQLQFGAASFTLGMVGVDIFTNGNFKIDLGFPHNRDFTNSFAVEALYFNGQGGLYLGLLNGATSDRVPRITNGTFSPVLELGVGLSIGAGRTFRKGALNATVIANVVGIFEGVLGWFNPADRSRAPALYYYARGTVGIVIKVQGKVDLSVVSILVTLEVGAYATLTLEAYRPTTVSVDVQARVEASVKAFFVTLHFTYDIAFNASFELAPGGQAPWQLAGGATDRTRARLLGDAHAPARLRGETATLLARAAHVDARLSLTGAAAEGWQLDFDQRRGVFPDRQVRALTLSLTPMLTVADVPIAWEGDAPAVVEGEPAYRVALLLTAATAVPPDARTAEDARDHAAPGEEPGGASATTPFALLSEAVFRWTLAAAGYPSAAPGEAGPLVTRGALLEIIDQLAMPEAFGKGFGLEMIHQFLELNLAVRIEAPPMREDADAVSAAPVALPPVLTWTWHDPAREAPDTHVCDFATHQPVDAAYRDKVRRYFDGLDPRARHEQEPVRLKSGEPGDKIETLAGTVFRDYFLLLARASVQAVADQLGACPVALREKDSLRTIAHRFPRLRTGWTGVEGGTVERVAGDFGLSAAELRALNPGFVVPPAGQRAVVDLGISPQAVAESAANRAVTPDIVIDLAPFTVDAQPGDTLYATGDRHRIADKPKWLAETLNSAPRLLQPGAAIAMGGFLYAEPIALDRRTAAAQVYVRLTGPGAGAEAQDLAWYAGAIDTLNPDLGDIAAAKIVLVPSAFGTLDTPDIWTVHDGDAIDTIAATLALAHGAIEGSPFARWRTMFEQRNPEGILRELPEGSAAIVAPGETLASLAARLLLDPAGAPFATLAGNAALLRPLASIPIVGGRFKTVTGTLIENAQAAAVPLEAFATSAADVEGLLQVAPGDSLDIHDVPVLALEALVARLHDPRPAANVAGQVSRFMLNGVRLPNPRDDAPVAGLYELIGQQIAGPPPRTDGLDTDQRLALKVTASSPIGWLKLADPLEVILSEGDLTHYPLPALLPQLANGGLRRLPAAREMPVRHAITQSIRWRTTVLPALPVAAVQPSLWLLSDAMTQRARGGIATDRYDIVQSAGAAPGAAVRTLEGWSWATLVDLTVQRIAGVTDTIELIGADPVDRQRLAQLLIHLGKLETDAPDQQVASTDTPQLHIAWKLSPGAGGENGLTSAPFDPDRSVLIKTNLSTQTRSGLSQLSATTPASEFHASLAEDNVAQFLTLAWECSIVGGGGYWLRLSGTDGLPLVPDAAFDQNGRAALTLIVQLESQAKATDPDRRLHRFNNGLIVGEAIDPGSVTLHAIATQGGPTQHQALLAPGEIGFALDLCKPDGDPDADVTPAIRTRQLYSIAGYALVEDPSGHEGQPLAPQVARNTDGSPDRAHWSMIRTIPIHRFRRSRLPDVPGLPPIADDPYAGIAAEAPAEVAIWFNDVLGNRTSTASRWRVTLPVQYHDPLTSPGSWPATALAFEILGDGTTPAHLSARASFQPGTCQPGAGESGADAAESARGVAAALAAIWYQIAQPGVEARLPTSVRTGAAEADPPPVDIARLRDYVAAGHLYARACAAAGAASLPDEDGTWTPRALLRQFGVEPVTLAAANAATAMADLFADASIGVPRFAIADARTVASAIAPPGGNPATMLADPRNGALPLRDGVVLVTAVRRVHVAVEPNADPTPMLVTLLDRFRTTIDDVAEHNAASGALFAPGARLTYNDFIVAIPAEGADADISLDTIRDRFAALMAKPGERPSVAEPNIRDILRANARKRGLFRPGAQLQICGYRAAQGETLDSVAAMLGEADLAAKNIATPGLFASGTPILLRVESVPVAGQTLARFAQEQDVQPGDLLRFNPDATLVAGTLLPGRMRLPTDLLLPCSVRSGDTLASIAARTTAGSAAELVRRNAALPDTLRVGAAFDLGGAHPVTVEAGDSFDAIVGRAGSTRERLVDAIANDPGALRPGALLIVPPGRTPAGAAATPATIAASWEITPARLLAANAGTPGLLVESGTLLAGVGDTVEPLAPDDTLSAVLGRLEARGIKTSIDQLADANRDRAILASDARYLIPPADAVVETQLAHDPVPGHRPLFAVRAALRIERPALCDPDPAWGARSMVASVEAALPPKRSTAAADADARGAASLKTFVDNLERALPHLRIAIGKTEGEPDTDLWAMLFDTDPARQTSIAPGCKVPGLASAQPRSFALRPLSTALVDRDAVAVQMLAADGTLGAVQTHSFHAVDMDGWARLFFADVERLLGHDAATAAYRASPTALTAILTAKRQLAQAISVGSAPVLADMSASGAASAAAARALRQALLASLSDGYAAAAVVQFEATVTAPWTDPVDAPRLVGTLHADTIAGAANFTDPKLVLTAGAGFLSSVMTVPDVAQQEQLTLRLDYPATELEFHRHVRLVVPGQDRADAYASSDWARFVNRPPVATDLGTSVIPLPLRSYPAEPALVAHRALPVPLTSIADAARWRYAVDFRHSTAEQDRITLRLIFNAGDAPLQTGAPDPDDLFAQLARYHAVAPELHALLATLSAETTAATANALESFATLAGNIAGAWQRRNAAGGPVADAAPLAQGAPGAPAPRTADWSATLQSDGGMWRTLTLRRGEGAEALPWPDIAALPATGDPIPLIPDPAQGATCIYRLPVERMAHVALDWRFTFDGLHLASAQSANVALSIDRNSTLIDTAATHPDFIYRTPPASFATAVVPTQRIDTRIVLAPWPRLPLEALSAALGMLGGEGAAALTVGYGFALTGGSDPIETVVPVLFLPAGTVTPDTLPRLRIMLDDWLAQTRPETEGGFWQFALTLFSDGGAPLLDLRELRAWLTERVAAPVVRALAHESGELVLHWADIADATGFEVLFDQPDAPEQPAIPAIARREPDGWSARAAIPGAPGQRWRGRIRATGVADAGPWSVDSDVARIVIVLMPPVGPVTLSGDAAQVALHFPAIPSGHAYQLRIADAADRTVIDMQTGEGVVRFFPDMLPRDMRLKVRTETERMRGDWYESGPVPRDGLPPPANVRVEIVGDQVMILFDRVAGAWTYEAHVRDAAGAALAPPLVVEGLRAPLSFAVDRLPQGQGRWQVSVRALRTIPLDPAFRP